jgi:serine/threonine protein kinase
MQAYLTEQHLCLAMELAEGGDLHSYVQEKGRLIESQARPLFQQVSQLPCLLKDLYHQTKTSCIMMI